MTNIKGSKDLFLFFSIVISIYFFGYETFVPFALQFFLFIFFGIHGAKHEWEGYTYILRSVLNRYLVQMFQRA